MRIILILLFISACTEKVDHVKMRNVVINDKVLFRVKKSIDPKCELLSERFYKGVQEKLNAAFQGCKDSAKRLDSSFTDEKATEYCEKDKNMQSLFEESSKIADYALYQSQSHCQWQ